MVIKFVLAGCMILRVDYIENQQELENYASLGLF